MKRNSGYLIIILVFFQTLNFLGSFELIAKSYCEIDLFSLKTWDNAFRQIKYYGYSAYEKVCFLQAFLAVIKSSWVTICLIITLFLFGLTLILKRKIKLIGYLLILFSSIGIIMSVIGVLKVKLISFSLPMVITYGAFIFIAYDYLHTRSDLIKIAKKIIYIGVTCSFLLIFLFYEVDESNIFIHYDQIRSIFPDILHLYIAEPILMLLLALNLNK